MNLEWINNLINVTKENNIAENFIKELGEFLGNEMVNNDKNQVSLVQKILDGRILTARYRDKIYLESDDIINKYSKENSERGSIYYVHNIKSDNTYAMVEYKNGESGKSIAVKESELPNGAGVDSVLRIKNGRFVLDKEATEKLQEELTEMINLLLEEQSKKLEAQRVEGHIYEFVEKSGDSIFLCDETDFSGECFQEIDFPSEIFANAKQGDLFQYVNGEYRLYSNK